MFWAGSQMRSASRSSGEKRSEGFFVS